MVRRRRRSVRRKKQNILHFKEHKYLAILLTLVVFLFFFAFTSPVNFGGEITGRAVELVQSSPPLAALSFFALLFGILLLILFTHNLMSKVL